jgi:hypothetical protein
MDIIDEIGESAKYFSLSGRDTSFVFHRANIKDQIVVTKKALSYVESLISITCVHLLKGARVEGNPVQAYLGTLDLSRVKDLLKDVDDALEQCEDSNIHMSVYRGGEDLAQRIREQWFSMADGRRPHKATDSLQWLHDRLGCYNQYHIPIGFYYSKWSEKLHFHLSKMRKQEGNHSPAPPSRSCTPSPARRDSARKSPKIASSSAAGGVTVEKGVSEKGKDTLKEIQETRAAIFDDTKDGRLTTSKHHKAVFRYRQDRKQKWLAVASETMANEEEWNTRHDEDALKTLREMEENFEALIAEHQKAIGDGPAGQGSN